MIEYISGSLFYWHWILLGLALVTTELFATCFIMIWFGLSGIIVGILQLTLGIDLNIQVIIWLSLSSIFLFCWHKLLPFKLSIY